MLSLIFFDLKIRSAPANTALLRVVAWCVACVCEDRVGTSRISRRHA